MYGGAGKEREWEGRPVSATGAASPDSILVRLARIKRCEQHWYATHAQVAEGKRALCRGWCQPRIDTLAAARSESGKGR